MKAKKILVAIDFSDYANAALKLATELAASNGAEIYLFNAVPQINVYDWNMTGVVLPPMQTEIDEIKKKCLEHLQKMVVDLKLQNPTINFSIDVSTGFGIISDAIIETAKEKQVDLILLGSHGRKGLDRVLMGSVAEAVMRHAHCGVLIYKPAVK